MTPITRMLTHTGISITRRETTYKNDGSIYCVNILPEPAVASK